MSKSENKLNGLPTPTMNEMEMMLAAMKTRPTARLQEKVRHAPWQTMEGDSNMIRLRRMELVVSGAAVLLLVLVAAVVLLEWSPLERTIPGVGTGNETNEGTGEVNAAAPLPTRSEPTPTPGPAVPEGSVAWTAVLPGGTDGTLSPAGVAYDAQNGRLFVANGFEGVQPFSESGEKLEAIAVIDPATGQPVFVYDVAWSQFLWLAPPEAGLVVLTEPLESGQYLHRVDPDSGSVLASFTTNSNIAIPATTELASERLPVRLSATGEGELYVDRVFTFAPETEGEAGTSFHYLLRAVLDGRILNSKAVGEETAEEPAQMIMDIAYSGVMDSVYAAVWHETSGIVQKFSLTGTPRTLATLDNGLVRWQEGVAISTDGRGHVYILVDSPGYIVELDQDDAVVNVYGFRDLERWDGNTAVTYWLPGGVGRPLAMAAAADGSMLFVVDEVEGGLKVTAYTVNGNTAEP